jgi:AIR synthase-related protein, sll0787 family
VSEYSLRTLLEHVRDYAGVQQKNDIQKLAAILRDAVPTEYPNGDDCAAIATADGYQLLAIEGFINRFVEADPWFAGWCGLMVNISDIAAMGGWPVAVVNAVWARQGPYAEKIMQGMVAASQTYQVPIVGGHSNLRSQQEQLSVAILGKAQQLLSSFAAQPGQKIIVAVDLRGAYRAPFLNWNAATEAPPERLRGDLALLPEIARAGLASAAKDISQAGILGTLAMLLESSKAGAEVQLDNIPRPQHVAWTDWLCSFPSFGFLLTANSEKCDELLQCFESRDIAAAVIGDITAERNLWVSSVTERELFWDLRTQGFVGL